MNFYPHHIGDFNNGTRHLTRVERSVYRDAIELVYDTESALTSDLTKLSKRLLCNSEEEKEALKAVLAEFFIQTDDGFEHERCVLEIAKYRANTSAKARAGIASAASKKQKSTRVNNQEPVTSNQEPTTKNHEYSVAKATGAKAPLTPDEIIFGYGVPLLTNAGTTDKQARSFLGGLRKSHGDDALVDGLRECIKAKPLQPLEWLAKILPPIGAPPKRNKQEQLEDRNRAIVDRLLAKENQ